MNVSPRFLIPFLVFPVCAAAQTDRTISGIRAFLPAANKAEAEPEAPVAVVSEQPAVTEQEEPLQSEQPPRLEFSADAERPADVSPEAHPESYKTFKERLDEQVKHNLEDYCPAISAVLSATNDEFALIPWMEKAAQEGNIAAISYVANARLHSIQHNREQAPEVKEAYNMLVKAAEAGFDQAAVHRYSCQRAGIGTPKDEAAAEKNLMEACKRGGFLPRFHWLQFTGRLKQYEETLPAEVMAEAKRGNHHVLYYLALLTPTAKEQITALQEAAIKGSADALYALSAICSKAKPKQSYELLQQAIKRHNAEAMWTLGGALCELNSTNPLLKEAGIVPDDKMGRHLVRLAAMVASPTANLWLGNAYYTGNYGIRQDAERAYRHFEQGAARGHAPCGAAQGYMLLKGIGTQADTKRGILLIRGAANAGYPYAVVLFAYAHFKGLGVPADADKAITLLQEAAAMGYPEAYIYMAYIAAKGGVNLPANAERADKYIRMAALDLREKARKMYEDIQKDGEWIPHP